MFEEGAKKLLFSLNGATVRAGDSCQRGNIGGCHVRHWVELQVAPEIFHGVELGSIRWKEKGMESAPMVDEHLNPLRPMGQETIPDDNDGSFQLV